MLQFTVGYDDVAGPRASEATLRDETRRRDARLSRGPFLVQVVVGYRQAPMHCFVQCTFYLMNDIFRKSRKREPAVRGSSGFTGRIF
jgi:hypothetical protein